MHKRLNPHAKPFIPSRLFPPGGSEPWLIQAFVDEKEYVFYHIPIHLRECDVAYDGSIIRNPATEWMFQHHERLVIVPNIKAQYFYYIKKYYEFKL